MPATSNLLSTASICSISSSASVIQVACAFSSRRLTRRVPGMSTCHYTPCRKVGASTLVYVSRDSFTLTSGSGAIVTYAPEAPYKYYRSFCARCGTSLGEITSNDESFPVAANCFDDELPLTNAVHTFVKEKPNWYCICDDAKQFSGHPM